MGVEGTKFILVGSNPFFFFKLNLYAVFFICCDWKERRKIKLEISEQLKGKMFGLRSLLACRSAWRVGELKHSV